MWERAKTEWLLGKDKQEGRAMYEGPGIYRHYKGGEYEVVGLGFNEGDKEYGFEPVDPAHQVVIYRPLTLGGPLDDTPVTFWTRALRDFAAEIQAIREGDDPRTTIPRFRKIAETH